MLTRHFADNQHYRHPLTADVPGQVYSATGVAFGNGFAFWLAAPEGFSTDGLYLTHTGSDSLDKPFPSTRLNHSFSI